MHYIALGGCLAGAILWGSLALHAQEQAPVERALAVEAGTESEANPTVEHDKANTDPSEAEGAPNDTDEHVRKPAQAEQQEPTPALKSDENPQNEANEIARSDLAAQQSMAETTLRLVEIAWWQVSVSIIAVTLLMVTIYYTHQAAVHAKGANAAAQNAAEQTRRQADAAILLKAEKIVFSEGSFVPPGGGVITTRGIPEDGRTPLITMKNIGKTRAFILKTCLVLRVSVLPPERRYPIAFQVQWPVAPGVQADRTFEMRDRTLTVALTDQQCREIQAGREHIWLLVGIWFKDWFGIERREELLLRWMPSLEPGAPPGTRLGFTTHDDAE